MAQTSRKRSTTDQTELVTELITLVRDQIKGQNEVLKVAMEAQKANADILAKWMNMFTPSTTPQTSTSEEERILMREERKDEWDPIPFGSDPFTETN